MMGLAEIPKMSVSFTLRGAELEVRALTIAESHRLGVRFPQYDFFAGSSLAEAPAGKPLPPLVPVPIEGQNAFIATALGYGGDPEQEAAVSRLTEGEQDEITQVFLLMSCMNCDIQVKRVRSNARDIILRGVGLRVRLLSIEDAFQLVKRFPEFIFLMSPDWGGKQLVACPEPAINAFIAAGLGCGGDPAEEALVSNLTWREQVEIIAMMIDLMVANQGAPAEVVSDGVIFQ